MWILVPVNDEIVMNCQSIELKDEELENSSFELYIRYNLLQFLSKDEIYILDDVPMNKSHHSRSFMMSLLLR